MTRMEMSNECVFTLMADQQRGVEVRLPSFGSAGITPVTFHELKPDVAAAGAGAVNRRGR